MISITGKMTSNVFLTLQFRLKIQIFSKRPQHPYQDLSVTDHISEDV